MPQRAWFNLERVNRYGCRLLLNDFTSSYECLLQKLKLQSVQNTCISRQLRLCYRYCHGMRQFPADLRVPNVQISRYNLRERGHTMQLSVPTLARLAALPIFVTFRVWNSLDLHRNAVTLEYRNFLLYLKHAAIYPHILGKFVTSGRENCFYSIADL